MRTRTGILLAVVTLGLGGPVVAAHAFDLTGHWVGKWSCRGFDGGKFTSGNNTSTMAVTQVPGTFAVAIDAATDDFTYNGVAVPDGKKPDVQGEAELLGCHLGTTLPNAPFDVELVRASVKTKANSDKATLKGTSIFVDGSPEAGTCRYSYKRIDTIDPNLSACP